MPVLNVTFIPEEKGVEMLARQIKMTGRAYPLFQIALLIPALASLLGLLNSIRMLRLPDIEPHADLIRDG